MDGNGQRFVSLVEVHAIDGGEPAVTVLIHECVDVTVLCLKGRQFGYDFANVHVHDSC